MKKLISIALAAVMLAAASVPAFAANPITKETDNTGTAIVKTSTKTGPDAPDDNAAKYTVTIPADTTIYWGAEETALDGFSVESHLKYGQKLKIGVEGSRLMKLSEDENETLAYDFSADSNLEFIADGPVINPAKALTLKVKVAADDWNNAIVGKYSDTLTFTVSL